MAIFLLVIGLVLFIGLILIHEWGHFITAKRNGVEIEEFGIFFPPRLFKYKTKAGWIFTINAIPLGGFVKMKGEHDSDTEKGSFGAASLFAKSKIMAAGVVMNFITAFVLFLILALVGMPHIVDNQYQIKSDAKTVHSATYKTTIDTVEKGSPAASAGLKKGDVITALGPTGNLKTLSASQDLPTVTKKFSGQRIEIAYKHNGKIVQKSTILRTTAEINAAAKEHKTIGRLGVGTTPSQDGLTVVRSTWSSPIVAGGTMVQLTGLTFQGIGKAFAGLGGTIAGALSHNTVARQSAQTEASGQVSGVVGIFFVFKYGALLGFSFILMIVAVVSLTLAIMNILPFPPLDGGKLWITLIAHGIKRPLSAHQEDIVNSVGTIAFLGLFALVTFVDIRRFF